MRGLHGLLGSIWTIKVLAWATLIVLVVYKRFRHAIVGLISVQAAALLAVALSACGGRGRSGSSSRGLVGWSMPSRPVAILAAVTITICYTLVPKAAGGRPPSGAWPRRSPCSPSPVCTWASTRPATCWSGRPSGSPSPS